MSGGDDGPILGESYYDPYEAPKLVELEALCEDCATDGGVRLAFLDLLPMKRPCVTCARPTTGRARPDDVAIVRATLVPTSSPISLPAPARAPFVAAAVHYYDHKGEGPLCALVTRVCDPVEAGEGACDLVVFHDTALAFELVVEYSDATAPGDNRWAWPPAHSGDVNAGPGVRLSDRGGL